MCLPRNVAMSSAVRLVHLDLKKMLKRTLKRTEKIEEKLLQTALRDATSVATVLSFAFRSEGKSPVCHTASLLPLRLLPRW